MSLRDMGLSHLMGATMQAAHSSYISGGVNHLIGKSDHWKFESLSGSVCLYQHLEEAPITTTRNSVPPQRAQHVSIKNAQKLSSFLRLFSLFFYVRMKRPLENQPPVGHPWLLGLGMEAERLGCSSTLHFGDWSWVAPLSSMLQPYKCNCGVLLSSWGRAAKLHSWLQLFIFPKQRCLHKLHECKSTWGSAGVSEVCSSNRLLGLVLVM